MIPWRPPRWAMRARASSGRSRWRLPFFPRSASCDDGGRTGGRPHRASAASASEIDFAGDAFSHPVTVLGVDDFSHEFVSWSAGKPVIAALKLEIGGTDTAFQEMDAREARRQTRKILTADRNASGFEMD